jgi:glycosyltransferase involved in cell wall biosynthesis
LPNLLKELNLEGIQQGQLFDHYLGTQIQLTDKDGKLVTVQTIPGKVASVSGNNLGLTPNDTTKGTVSFNVPDGTIIRKGTGTVALSALAVGDKVVVITNGFDRREFEAATSVDTGGKFTVIYCGALYAHQRPAFTAFCQAWSHACARNTDFRERARFWAVGRSDPEMVQAPAQWPKMNVRFLGYQPHTEAIRHLVSADMLLLLIKNLTTSADTVVTIPGKTFEYLASGAPILMIGPEGDAASVVRAGGQGTVHNEADIDGMTQSLLRQFQQFREGKRQVGALSAERVHYDRESLTARLAQELESVVARQ